jgi:hypothetical protein
MKGLRTFAHNLLMKKGVLRSAKELLAGHTRRNGFHLRKTKFELPLDNGRAVMIREIRATGIHRDILRVWFIGKDHLGDHYTILFMAVRKLLSCSSAARIFVHNSEMPLTSSAMQTDKGFTKNFSINTDASQKGLTLIPYTMRAVRFLTLR